MKRLFDFDPKSYGPIFAELLQEDRLNPLDAGTPNTKIRLTLTALTIENAFASHKIVDADMARACSSAIWLYHDFLEESHQISQSIATPAGSYWHGIMHRREMDFSNSKYWFHRVGTHPIFISLHRAAAELAATNAREVSTAFLLNQSRWDPFAFIDLCENCVQHQSPAETLCRQIQRAEWNLLFDHCHQQAVGGEAIRRKRVAKILLDTVIGNHYTASGVKPFLT